MNRKHENPIDAEADMIRRSVLSAIDSLTPKEKDAFYQAMADALRNAFNTDANFPGRPRRVEPESRTALKASLRRGLSGLRR